MSCQIRARAAFFERPRPASFLHRLRKLASTLLLAGVVHGCAATPMAPFAGPDPSDGSARIPAVSYHSTIGSFANLRPVEPAPWKKENAPVAPAPKPVLEPKS